MVKCLSLLLVIISLYSCDSHKRSGLIPVENARKGETLFNTVGCVTCHSISGENKYGPPLNSIFEQDMRVIRNGTKYTVKADRQYILRSMKEPDFEKLDTFQNKKMPKVNLTGEEIDYLVDYLIYINMNHINGPIGK